MSEKWFSCQPYALMHDHPYKMSSIVRYTYTKLVQPFAVSSRMVHTPMPFTCSVHQCARAFVAVVLVIVASLLVRVVLVYTCNRRQICSFAHTHSRQCRIASVTVHICHLRYTMYTRVQNGRVRIARKLSHSEKKTRTPSCIRFSKVFFTIYTNFQ